MDGGSLAVSNDGKLSSVWRREQTIFPAMSQEPEIKLGSSEQPAIAATSKGNVFAWLCKRGDDLMLKVPGTKAHKIAGNDYDPAMASTTEETHVWIAWEGEAGWKGDHLRFRAQCRQVGRR